MALYLVEQTNREKDLIQALKGTAKSALSTFPVLGQIVATYDAYKKSSYERNMQKIIADLQRKVDDLNAFFSEEWVKTEDGQQFCRKVLDSALDDQLTDKQELFVNALINGVRDKDTPFLEKLKFVDMLRHLSRASIMVLAKMHKMLIAQVRGPGREPDPISSYPLVDPTSIAESLSDEYDPYLVTSSISEMESQGMFSRTGEWRRDPTTGGHTPGGGFATEMCYTDFAARFVEFIRSETIKEIEP